MAHYVLRSLIDKSSVKVKNFSKNPNKRNYSYILTPTSLSEKLKLTSVFLERKHNEYTPFSGKLAPSKKVLKRMISSLKIV